MSAQSVSIAVMFSWVVDSFKLLNRNFLTLIAASGVTLVFAIAIMLPMGIGMALSAGNMSLFYTVYAVSIVISLLLFPPLLVGWFRLCQNIDQNKAVSGLDILKPYKDTRLWLRGLSFALLALLIYTAILSLVGLAFGSAFAEGFQQIMAQQTAAMSGAPTVPPVLPAGFFLGYFCFVVIGTFLQFIYLVGFAEISLRETTAVEALKLATAGTFKNLLKLIVFLICLFTVLFIALFLVALILGLIIGLLSLIHPVIGVLAAIAIYIPVLLCMYPLMFASQYFVWKSMLGGGDLPAIPNSYDSTLSV